MKVYKNRPQHVFTSWHDWGSPDLQALSSPSFPHPEPLHLQYLNMSGASFFAGAHRFVASDSTIFEAKTVSGMITKGIGQAS